MRNAISLDGLRVISAIAQKGSFAEAAKSLFKVPSAITYTVAKLESYLQVSLFDRQGQRATLTQAGKLLLKDGEALLEAAGRLEQSVKQVESGWETRLTIAKDTIVQDAKLLSVVGDFCLLAIA